MRKRGWESEAGRGDEGQYKGKVRKEGKGSEGEYERGRIVEKK